MLARSAALLTTSWDDGHPYDLRVAEMLTRHGIPGTFYVPRSAETGTMSLVQLRELARRFEIGAHTLRHAILTEIPTPQAREEIAGSKSWVEDLTGTPCNMFCPPRGRFAREHLALVRRANFLGLRTVELISLNFPNDCEGVLVMPTSVQARPHRSADYMRNFIKRAALRNFWLYVICGNSSDWTAMACKLLNRVITRGGVFHLWGHSWELQAAAQWERLDEVLRLMAACTGAVSSLTNGQICASARCFKSSTRCGLS